MRQKFLFFSCRYHPVEKVSQAKLEYEHQTAQNSPPTLTNFPGTPIIHSTSCNISHSRSHDGTMPTHSSAEITNTASIPLPSNKPANNNPVILSSTKSQDNTTFSSQTRSTKSQSCVSSNITHSESRDNASFVLRPTRSQNYTSPSTISCTESDDGYGDVAKVIPLQQVRKNSF